jgi:predicted dehydrogenase
LPSLRAGKGLVVEWPIDISFSESQEIVELAHAKGLRTAVDIQGRFSKIIEQVAEVVNSGRIGRVLSTSVSGGVPTGGAEPENVGVKYSLQDGSGATIVDIHLAHILECLTHIHGPVRSVSSLIKTMRPTTDIVDMSTGEILEKDVEKSAPDQILVHGELVHGGALNIHLHGGVGIGGATWNIIGEKGEIVLSAPALIPWINAPNPWKLKILDSSGITEEDVHEDEPGKQLAVNRLWDAFLAGKSDTWPDFAHALSIQKVIDTIKRSNTEKVTVLLEQDIV